LFTKIIKILFCHSEGIFLVILRAEPEGSNPQILRLTAQNDKPGQFRLFFLPKV